MRGYIDLGGEPVTWRGLTSVYTLGERDLMRSLPVREQAIVHLLKAFTPGEIADVGTGHSAPNQSANHGAVRPADEASVGENAASARRLGSNDPIGTSGLTFIDHEDIPFGDAMTQSSHHARKRPVYALVWTPAHNRVYKTKAKATKKTRAWKKWKERNGWKVISHDSGYFAARGDEREAITLHEYDRDTKERLK